MQKAIRNILTPKVLGVIAVLYTSALTTVCLIKLDLHEVDFSYGDKVFHLMTYFVLTCLWFMQYFVSRKVKSFECRKIFFLAACLLCFGMVIEILQLVLTDYRSFDWFDMLANSCGVLFAALFILAIKSYLMKLKNEFLR